MTRDYAKQILAKQLQTSYEVRDYMPDNYKKSQEFILAEASLLLTFLESIGFQPPTYNKEHGCGYDEITGWEDSNETL